MQAAVDTILAVASPPGHSLRGIVRISGPQAFALVDAHATSVAVDEGRAVWRAIAATLALPTLPAFRVFMFRFAAPRSYTGEDSVELQMPGNPTLLTRVIDDLIASGAARGLAARRAEAGEFTARAFLNGRLSLTQAEGVAATIAARSDAELAAARLLTSGRLGDFGRRLADELATALALVEAGIDFTDQEDVVAIAPDDLACRLEGLTTSLRGQLARAVGMERLQAIPHAVLVGAPNAGKSALFNALLGHERVVVSHIAGTTRDAIAEPLAIDTDHGRAEVMLVDIAGLDHADVSPMNALMQRAAKAAIDRADLRLLCVPADEDLDASARSLADAAGDAITVRTKCDLHARTLNSDADGSIRVSTVTGEGLDDLRRAIAARLADRAVSLAADALALQPRHEAALRSALSRLEAARALTMAQRGERSLADAELIAAEMRGGLNDLASLAGDLTPDDILGRIFATFCVGK